MYSTMYSCSLSSLGFDPRIPNVPTAMLQSLLTALDCSESVLWKTFLLMEPIQHQIMANLNFKKKPKFVPRDAKTHFVDDKFILQKNKKLVSP